MPRRTDAPGQMLIDYPRATKLWMLERLRAPSRVKAFLKALDAVVRDKPQDQVTLRKLAVSMGVHVATARRAAQDAKALGWLEYTEETDSGRANTYEIIWLPIFELTHKPSDEAADISSSTPSQIARGDSQPASPPPRKLLPPPSQIARGAPPPTIPPTNTRPDHGCGQRLGRGGKTEDLGAAIQSFLQQSNASDQPSIPNQKRTWVGHVEPRDLLDVSHLHNLARNAARAGFVAPGREGVLVVLAAAHHVRRTPGVKNPGALFIAIVENKARWRLTTADFDHARSVVRELTAGVAS